MQEICVGTRIKKITLGKEIHAETQTQLTTPAIKYLTSTDVMNVSTFRMTRFSMVWSALRLKL